jgi:hypothetical protein
VNTLPTTDTTQEVQEAGPLARELAAAFRRMIEHYKQVYGLSLPEALARAQQASATYEASVLNDSADQVSWHGLDYLARQDPQKATRRWEEIKDAALDELRSGHRAAKAMEGDGPHCWTRAQFLAVRRDLMEAWQPGNGLERQLLDMLAQAQTAQLHWLCVPTLRCTAGSQRQRAAGKWEALTVSDAEATEQAAAMVERFHGIFLRTLRALCQLRKVPLAVVVQNAVQVNVGTQQVNVNSPGS